MPRLVVQQPSGQEVQYDKLKAMFLIASGVMDKEVSSDKDKSKSNEKSEEEKNDGNMCVVYRAVGEPQEVKKENNESSEEPIEQSQIDAVLRIMNPDDKDKRPDPNDGPGVKIKEENTEEDDVMTGAESRQERDSGTSVQERRRFSSPLPPEDDSDDLGIDLNLISVGFVEEITISDSPEPEKEVVVSPEVGHSTVSSPVQFQDMTSLLPSDLFERGEIQQATFEFPELPPFGEASNSTVDFSEFDPSSYVRIDMGSDSQSESSTTGVRDTSVSGFFVSQEGSIVWFQL